MLSLRPLPKVDLEMLSFQHRQYKIRPVVQEKTPSLQHTGHSPHNAAQQTAVATDGSMSLNHSRFQKYGTIVQDKTAASTEQDAHRSAAVPPLAAYRFHVL